MQNNEVKEAVAAAFPGESLVWSEFQGQLRLTVGQTGAFEVLKGLRERAGFDMLIDVTAVDLLEYPNARDRFELVYVLLNVDAGTRLLVSTFLNEPNLDIASVVPIWDGANWLEREVCDMFGIRFIGHPNLKRLLLPDAFTSYPLRKDYPMQGRGERHNFHIITRSES